jgi:hypothetical protein
MALSLASAITQVGDEWRATPLYHALEQTEKAMLSYRVGTALAGVYADLELDIMVLQHRAALFGSDSGPRGDMVGRSAVTGWWHGVEAKGRGPRATTGGYTSVSEHEFAVAKSQAMSLGSDLILAGMSAARDH